MSRRSAYARSLSALALGTALLAGCGGAGDEAADRKEAAPKADVLVAAAAAKSNGTGSSKISLMSTTQIGGQEVTFAGDGAYDYTKKIGQFAFGVPGADGAGGGSIEQRIIGDDLYLTLPQQPGTFFRLKVSEVAGTSLGGSVDPTASLTALQAISDVREVGEQDVRGVQTTHYEGEYDIAKAVEQAQGVAKTVISASLRGAKVDKVPFDAYLDDEGRLVKFSQLLELPATAATGGAPVTSETTIELYDFGATVTVVPPPAASVKDGAPLLAALRSAMPQASPTAAPKAPPAPASVAPSPAG